jgi:hypothetical protein
MEIKIIHRIFLNTHNLYYCLENQIPNVGYNQITGRYFTSYDRSVARCVLTCAQAILAGDSRTPSLKVLLGVYLGEIG